MFRKIIYEDSHFYTNLRPTHQFVVKEIPIHSATPNFLAQLLRERNI